MSRCAIAHTASTATMPSRAVPNKCPWGMAEGGRVQYGAPLCGDPPSDAGSRHVKSRRLFCRRGIGRNAGRKASKHKRGAESVSRVCGRKQKGTAGVMIKGRYVGDQLGNFVVFVSVAKHLAASRTCGAVNPSLRVCLSGCTASFPRRLLVELLALG